jgi:hypothetical protein
LNRTAHIAGGTPWSCRLAEGDQWLASMPAFRESFLELCRYFDCCNST